MTPLLVPYMYTFQDVNKNVYSVQFSNLSPNGCIAQSTNGNVEPQSFVPYSYLDPDQLYVVVFGANLQLSGDPMPTTDDTTGEIVFKSQIVRVPNPVGYDAWQFSVAGLDPNQVYISLDTQAGKIKAKPLIYSATMTTEIVQKLAHIQLAIKHEINQTIDKFFSSLLKR